MRMRGNMSFLALFPSTAAAWHFESSRKRMIYTEVFDYLPNEFHLIFICTATHFDIPQQ